MSKLTFLLNTALEWLWGIVGYKLNISLEKEPITRKRCREI